MQMPVKLKCENLCKTAVSCTETFSVDNMKPIAPVYATFDISCEQGKPPLGEHSICELQASDIRVYIMYGFFSITCVCNMHVNYSSRHIQ